MNPGAQVVGVGDGVGEFDGEGVHNGACGLLGVE